ncbi:MAG: hypothetical protein OEW08_04230 [Gammaproteobacteria bacterium]|nr:hypothetical protein [Gammaproteobacteria bacterium]
MSSGQDNTDILSKYNVISVEKSDPPAGMTGNDWYRYVIGVGNSQVIGNKPGTLNTVTEHARTAAEDLNARAARSGSVYAPRLKKK